MSTWKITQHQWPVVQVNGGEDLQDRSPVTKKKVKNNLFYRKVLKTKKKKKSIEGLITCSRRQEKIIFYDVFFIQLLRACEESFVWGKK